MSTLSQETKNHLNQKGWILGNTKIGLVLEVTTCCLKVNMLSKSELSLWTKTILTRGSEFLMVWISRFTELSNNKENDDNELETSELQFEDYEFKLNAGDFAGRSKAKGKPLPVHPQKLYLMGEEFKLTLNYKIVRSRTIQCQRNWSIFFVMEICVEKMMERLKSGE